MSNTLNHISFAAVIVGGIWFVWTGIFWQFLPISAAILISRFASQAVKADEVPTIEVKGTKKK